MNGDPERRALDQRLIAWAGEARAGAWDEDDARFDALARDLFAFQYARCAPYRRLCQRRGVAPATLDDWREIPADEVEAEEAAPPSRRKRAKKPQKKKDVYSALKGLRSKGRGLRRKIAFTNMGKTYWPVEGYTKGDLIDYYEDDFFDDSTSEEYEFGRDFRAWLYEGKKDQYAPDPEPYLGEDVEPVS